MLGIKRAQIEGVKDPEGAVLPNYDLEGLNIKELALEYMKQRKTVKVISTMPTTRKNLETHPLETEDTNIKAYVADNVKTELVENFSNFSSENDLLKLIDEEFLTSMLASLGLRPSKKLHKKLVKDLCLNLFNASCRARLNDRTVIKTHDL